MKHLLALAALALPPGWASAQDTQPAAAKPEKKICRMEEVSGSILRKRICLTRAEWKQMEAAYAEREQNLLDQRKLNSNGMNSTHLPH